MTKSTPIYAITLFSWNTGRYLVRFYRRAPHVADGEQAHSYKNLTTPSLQRLQRLIGDGKAVYLPDGRAQIRKHFGPPFIPPTEES